MDREIIFGVVDDYAKDICMDVHANSSVLPEKVLEFITDDFIKDHPGEDIFPNRKQVWKGICNYLQTNCF